MTQEPKVFFEGPDAIKRIGPITIEYHHYGGPTFWLWWGPYFDRALRPGRYSPLWLLWALVRKDMEGTRD